MVENDFEKKIMWSYQEFRGLRMAINPITYGGGAFWPGPSDYRPQL